MRRLVIVALVGIGIIAAVGIAVVMLATSGGPPSPAPEAAAPDPYAPSPPPPVGAPGSPPSSDLPAGLVAKGVTTVVEKDPPPPRPEPGSWEAVPVAARAGALGPAGAALQRELNDLHPKLSACFDEEAQARHGQTGGPTAVNDVAPQDDAGTTVLMLELETSPGAITIVDAPVEARGGASDGLIVCAQGILRGKVFEAPGARGGGRHRMLYPLIQ